MKGIACLKAKISLPYFNVSWPRLRQLCFLLLSTFVHRPTLPASHHHYQRQSPADGGAATWTRLSLDTTTRPDGDSSSTISSMSVSASGYSRANHTRIDPCTYRAGDHRVHRPHRKRQLSALLQHQVTLKVVKKCSRDCSNPSGPLESPNTPEACSRLYPSIMIMALQQLERRYSFREQLLQQLARVASIHEMVSSPF